MQEKNQFFKIWQVTVLGAVIWWVIGLNLFIYHIIALVLFLQLILISTRTEKSVILSPAFIILFILVVVYVFSILIHAHAAIGTRAMAALYNLSFWVMGVMLILAM